MKTVAFMSAMLMIVLSAGCASRHIYDSLRFSQEIECQKLPKADQEECLKKSTMSYDEYQQQLKTRQPAR